MNNKKQHYVPSTYLNAFTDPTINGEQVWVYSSKLKKIFPQSPKNILTEDNMYTVPFPSGERNLNIEKALTTIEGNYARVYKEKINQGKSLDKDDKEHLARFVAAMLMRTKERKEWILDANDKIIDLLIRTEEAYSVPESASQRKKLEASRDTIHQKSLLFGLPSITVEIFKMGFQFLSPETHDIHFLTSDNPCNLINPTLIANLGPDHPQNSAGLSQPDVELTLPLSPTKALFASWKSIKEPPILLPVSAQIVQQINWRTMRHAGEYIISCSKTQLIELINSLKLDYIVATDNSDKRV